MTARITARQLLAEYNAERERQAKLFQAAATVLREDARKMRLCPGVKMMSKRIEMAELFEQQANAYTEAAIMLKAVIQQQTEPLENDT